jgi:hypothetical protein
MSQSVRKSYIGVVTAAMLAFSVVIISAAVAVAVDDF